MRFEHIFILNPSWTSTNVILQINAVDDILLDFIYICYHIRSEIVTKKTLLAGLGKD